jgi:hypothetical protein
MCQPIQHTSPDAAWVKTQVVEATIDELSKVSLVDAATILLRQRVGGVLKTNPADRCVANPGPHRSTVMPGALDLHEGLTINTRRRV